MAVAIAGCGLGPGPGTSDVNLTITRHFGSNTVASLTVKQVPGSETVMRMLERRFRIRTRYGGGFVESINGYSGDSTQRDWLYFVNGIQADKGAAATAVHKGDRIWWDLHDWSHAESVPAVVGSFPEPFLHGTAGKRLPTVLECAPDVPAACARVGAELKAVGVPVANQLLGGGSGSDSLAVLVGTWSDLHPVIAAELIDHGPSTSGVYAKFAAGGASLQLLDPRGNVVRTLSAGAGLVAATRDQVSDPTWLITGTDKAGVNAAAAALTPSALQNHFALAVAGGHDLPVPLEAGR